MFSTTHIHPMLVHFPIALVAFGFLAEIASWYFKKEVCLVKTGYWLLLTGTIAAVAAYLAGVFFTPEMSGTPGQVKETHEMFAFITVCLLILTSAFKSAYMIKKMQNPALNYISIVLYALAAVSVGITGFYGGTLVFNYMMPL